MFTERRATRTTGMAHMIRTTPVMIRTIQVGGTDGIATDITIRMR